MQINPTNTTKQKALRVPLSYDKTVDPVTRWKRRLSVGALIVSVIYAVYILGSSGGPIEASRGPVASVHATWDVNCSACHVDQVWPWTDAIGENAFFAAASDGKFDRPVDGKCRTCHEGPEHHGNNNPTEAADRSRHYGSENPAEVASCASCHREHRGRDARLTRCEDRHCLKCHADLAEHTDNPKKYREEDAATWRFQAITRFDQQHPKFQSLEKDPGTIKFNHILHMSPGLVASGSAREKWTWRYLKKNMTPENAQRYKAFLRKVPDNSDEVVELTCSACHRLDAADSRLPPTSADGITTNLSEARVEGVPPAAVLRPRSDGRYMLPITYERDCRACHPLYFDLQQRDNVAPHRMNSDEFLGFLLGYFSRKTGDGPDANRPARKAKAIDDPWKELMRIPHKPERPSLEPGGLWDDENLKRVVAAEEELRRRCEQCHHFERDIQVNTLTDRATSLESARIPVIQPAKIPQVWLQHARFDHAAHRSLACDECHNKAITSEESSDVLIEGWETCKRCHQPPAVKDATPVGGARFDCVECHRYHGGDNPLHGFGHRRGVKTALRINEFHNGL